MNNKQLRSRCKDTGHGGRQCQHVCSGVCKVCEYVGIQPRVTHATLSSGVANFASLMSNMSKPVVFAGDSVTAHLVAAEGRK